MPGVLPTGSYLLLTYDYVADMLDRRGPHRAAHLAHAAAAQRDGLLHNAGAVGDPPRGAVFVLADGDPAAVAAFVAADPYVIAGLVTGHRVDAWTVVV